MNALESTPRSGAIRNVLIVGGGTAGWMTAAILRRSTRHLGTRISLVEQPNIDTIGVGEATIPSLVQFVRAMDFDEAAFLRAVSGTYKLGIRFTDWIEPGHEYWHPFGPCGGQINGLDLFHFWSQRRGFDGVAPTYADYSLQVALAQQERAPGPFSGASPVIETGGYGYHLDAAKFAAFLRDEATGDGVEHIFGEVQSVTRRDDGGIASVDLVGDRTIAADLYVDCTASSVLIEKSLGDPWIDWSNLLLCDSTVAMPLPRTSRFAPYTHSTALDAGWMWQIPLSSRSGHGYVYSSAHTTEDQAAATLIDRADLKRARAADPRLLKNRVGRRQDFWQHNCVSIGPAAGFVEPLEATSLHLIQRGAEALVEFFPDQRFDPSLPRAYNATMASQFEEVRDFIILHYSLSRREGAFWQDARSVPLPASLQDKLALYDEIGVIRAEGPRVFRDASYYFILSGGDRLPRRPAFRADNANVAELDSILAQIRHNNRVFVDQMPTHRDLLAKLHELPL